MPYEANGYTMYRVVWWCYTMSTPTHSSDTNMWRLLRHFFHTCELFTSCWCQTPCFVFFPTLPRRSQHFSCICVSLKTKRAVPLALILRHIEEEADQRCLCHFTRVCVCVSEWNQAGGHGGISAVWRGVIPRTRKREEEEEKTPYECACVRMWVCNRR